MLGNGRLEAMCFDGTKRLCHIRGKLRKRQWINAQGISTYYLVLMNSGSNDTFRYHSCWFERLSRSKGRCNHEV